MRTMSIYFSTSVRVTNRECQRALVKSDFYDTFLPREKSAPAFSGQALDPYVFCVTPMFFVTPMFCVTPMFWVYDNEISMGQLQKLIFTFSRINILCMHFVYKIGPA